MNKTQWYEVFRSDWQGTQTVTTCQTANEARYYKRQYTKNKLPNEEYFIDKWEDTDNPHLIGDIN